MAGRGTTTGDTRTGTFANQVTGQVTGRVTGECRGPRSSRPGCGMLAAVAIAAGLAGCSGRQAPPPELGLGDEAPARSTTTAEPGRATSRPFPVVVTALRDRALRETVAAAGARAANSSEPATMAPGMLAESSPLQWALPAGAALRTTEATAPRLISAGGSPATNAGREPLPAAAATDINGEIRAMFADYLRAFDRRDAGAVAACWSESAENLSLDTGETTSGRDEVESVFQTLFYDDPAARIDLEIEAIRPLGDGVATVDGVSQTSFSDGEVAASRFSAVVMKRDGRWMLESVREASLPSQRSAREEAIAALEPLVGEWEDVSDNVTIRTHAFWTQGGGFLVRSHRVTSGDSVARPPRAPRHAPSIDAEPGDRGPRQRDSGETMEITEVIGWDPLRQGLRSWVFSSQGGFAEGSWAVLDDTFEVFLDGTLADGGLVSGELRIERVGSDEIVSTLDGGGLAELLPLDGAMVRTGRPAAPRSESRAGEKW